MQPSGIDVPKSGHRNQMTTKGSSHLVRAYLDASIAYSGWDTDSPDVVTMVEP